MLLVACSACESLKTLEPVRENGITTVSPAALQGFVSAALAEDVVVKVVDQRGSPLRNAQVTWTTGDGSITPSSTTNEQGEARAKWTLGATLGTQTATAKIGALTAQVTASAVGIWKSVQVGYTGTCALTKANTALCWGTNESGQLASGTPNVPDQTLTPGIVVASQKFLDLRLAYQHVCGVTTTNTTLCWGKNAGGQLGVPMAATPACASTGGPCASTPQAISGGIPFSSVSVGFYHTCGISAGRAYCWGNNNRGQLGIGVIDAVEHSTPTPVTGGLTFSSIVAGFEMTCGITASNQAYCWGFNDFGQLGNGTQTTTGTPTPVSGGLSFTSVASGWGYHVCGVTAVTQITYCWGSNDNAQLGNASQAAFSAVPLRVQGTQTFTSVAPALAHTCAITSDGAAYCWGANIDGVLGIGQQIPPELCGGGLTRCSRTPLAVSGGLAFTNLSANNMNTCGVTTLGGLYCWGLNLKGQFGNGSATKSEVPVPATTPTGVTLP